MTEDERRDLEDEDVESEEYFNNADEPFSEVTPEECLVVYHRGVQEGLDIIMEKFRNLIKKEARILLEQNPQVRLEREDLYGVGTYALINAVETFEFGRSVFAGYARLLIRREMRAYVRECSTKNAQMLNTAYSIDEEVFDDSKITLADTMGKVDPYIAHNVIPEDDNDNFFEYLDIEFSEEEKVIGAYRLKGYTYDEIIARTGWSRKKVFAIAKIMRIKLEQYQKQ